MESFALPWQPVVSNQPFDPLWELENIFLYQANFPYVPFTVSFEITRKIIAFPW